MVDKKEVLLPCQEIKDDILDEFGNENRRREPNVAIIIGHHAS